MSDERIYINKGGEAGNVPTQDPFITDAVRDPDEIGHYQFAVIEEEAPPVMATPPADDDVDAEPEASVVITLHRPIFIDGKEVTELRLDFDKLSARDLMNIEREMVRAGVAVVQNAAASTTYCLYVGARAAGVNIADLRRLSIRDGQQVLQAVQNFMLPSA